MNGSSVRSSRSGVTEMRLLGERGEIGAVARLRAARSRT